MFFNKRFGIDDTALILINHQVGMHRWVAPSSMERLQRNVMILAKFAVGAGIPVVLTTSQEQDIDMQGPLMPQLQALLPDEYAARIKRTGLINAWDAPAFADACRRTGRPNFVMAGVTIDVGVVSSALSAVEEGYDVQVVADACGSRTVIAEQMSYLRLERGGVRLTSTDAVVAELARNWTSPAGEVAFPLLT